jgi:DNA-binding transcriptional LysR family regulator
MGKPVSSRRITHRQLDVFRSVMANGSLSGAARELGVSQPGLSPVIKRLEDVAGVRLFERLPGGPLTATPEARRVLAEVERIYGQLDQITDNIAAISRGERAVFRIGLSASVAHRLAPRALALLAVRYPKTRFFCDNVTRDRIVDYLCFGPGECVASMMTVDHPALHSEQVATAALVCVVPRSHRLAASSVVRTNTLAAGDLIAFEQDTPHGRAIAELFARHHIPYDPRFLVRSTETALSLVGEGAGIAIVDQFSTIGIAPLGLAALAIEDSPVIPTFVHWPNARPPSVLTHAFVATLRRLAMDAEQTPRA